MPERENITPGKHFHFPYKLKVEPRQADVPKWFPLVLSLGAIIVALLLGAVILALVGSDPWKTYSHIAEASFGSIGVFSDTVVKAIPLLLVGLACALAFRMRLWNIGAEGQFFLGALAPACCTYSHFAQYCTQMALYPFNGIGWNDLRSFMGVYSRILKSEIQGK